MKKYRPAPVSDVITAWAAMEEARRDASVNPTLAELLSLAERIIREAGHPLTREEVDLEIVNQASEIPSRKRLERLFEEMKSALPFDFDGTRFGLDGWR